MYSKKRFIFLLLMTLCFTIFEVPVRANASDITQRLAGQDRYSTSIEISKSGWQQETQNVVLATGQDFPDALCAAPLAKQLNAPILLTDKSTLDTRVENELKRLGVKNVFIIGGYGAISQSIEKIITSKGMNAIRLSGNDRYETSLAVANYSGINFSKEIIVTTGDDYPDALSAAAVAAKKGMPIILSPKSQLPSNLSKYIAAKGITKTYVVGGTGAVSETVRQQLNAERVYGNDRYSTNTAVLNKFLSDLDFSTIYLATGDDYPDALSGSALAPKTSSPIILVNKASQNTVKDFILTKFSSIGQVKVLGGEGAVSTSILNTVVPKIVITNINDISANAYQGKSYTLPQKLTATMSNNSTAEVAVNWNPAVADTSKTGVFTYKGTVSDYGKQVNLTLTVNALHPIMGLPEVTAEKMAKFLIDNNPNPTIKCTALELAQMFIEEGKIEGVRGDIAFCQSIHETGWFKYGGLVLPEQNNYAGIGATNTSAIGKGAWFGTPREGVRAQIQHLKAYASKEPLKQACVDPRYPILVEYNLLGIAPNWEDLNGRWAVPGTTYGQSILELFEKVKSAQ